jgi:hypothetical protein
MAKSRRSERVMLWSRHPSFSRMRQRPTIPSPSCCPMVKHMPGETCAGIFRLKLGSAWKEQRRIDKNFTKDARRAAQQAEGDHDLGGTYLRMI